MASLAQVAKKSTAADFYDQYGPLAAPLREALGFGGQNNIDMLAPSRVSPGGGSDSGQGDSIAPSPALQKMIDDGLVTYGSNGLGGDQAAMGYTVNWDKMPKTAFGAPGAVGISGYDPSMKPALFNANAVAEDPNFGYVTPTANINANYGSRLDNAIYQYGPALFTAGLGAMAAIPSTVLQGMNATRMLGGIGSGQGFNPLSLLSLAGGAMGVPSWLTSGASTLANIARGGKPNPAGLVGPAVSAVGGGLFGG